MEKEYQRKVTRQLRSQAPGMVLDLRYIATEEPQPGLKAVQLDALLDSGCGNLHLIYDPAIPPEQLADQLLLGLTLYRQACLRQAESATPLSVPFSWQVELDLPPDSFPWIPA